MRNYKRIGVGLLVAVLALLLYVDIRQAQVIQEQRHLLIEMYQFIVAGCPFDQIGGNAGSQ